MAPASGAIVMGTGIVSVALSLDGRAVLSHVLLAVAAAAWVTLGLLLAARLRRDRAGVLRDAGTPAALTGVAATAVLGTGALSLGWRGAALALLAVAGSFWPVLTVAVLRRWTTPTVGVSLMLTVATESLAVLAAAYRNLLIVALALLALGLAFYVYAIARFRLRELATGAGDHWITGGALAISTLAAARIALNDGLEPALSDISTVLWAISMCWLPPLVAAELRFPRLGYDVRRWSTVFPVGMYAVCSFAVAAASASAPIRAFARAWTWVAVAVWLVVLAASLRAIRAGS